MRQFAFWLWMVFLALPAAVQAQAWVNTAYLEDPTQSLTIEEVASTTQAFVPTEHGFSAGYTRSVHWLRFELRPRGTDPTAPSVLEIRPPFLDDVRPINLKQKRKYKLLNHQGLESLVLVKVQLEL